MSKTRKMVTVPCSRCGGTGRYQFNLVHGSVCYGCKGSGTMEITEGAAKARERKARLDAAERESNRAAWQTHRDEIATRTLSNPQEATT